MNKAQRAYFELGVAYASYLNSKKQVEDLNYSISNNILYGNIYDELEYSKNNLTYKIKRMARKHGEAMLYRREVSKELKLELRNFGENIYSFIVDYYYKNDIDSLSAPTFFFFFKDIDYLINLVITNAKDTMLRNGIGQDRWNWCYPIYKDLKDKGVIKIKNANKTFDLTLANANLFNFKNSKISDFSEEELNTPFFRLEITNEKLWDLFRLLRDKKDGKTITDTVDIDKVNYDFHFLNSKIFNKIFGKEEGDMDVRLAYSYFFDDLFLFEINYGMDDDCFVRWLIDDTHVVQ